MDTSGETTGVHQTFHRAIALHKNALRTIPIQLITEVSIVLLRFLVSLYHRKGQSVSELSIYYEMIFQS